MVGWKIAPPIKQKRMKIIKTQYEKVGGCIQWEDKIYQFVGGYGESGAVYFKDEENFVKHPNEPCYVPEGVFQDEKNIIENKQVSAVCIVTDEYETYKTLLEKSHYNEQICRAMFDNLEWQHPDTWLNEWDEEDIAYFYDFVKVGNKVFWNEQPFKQIPLGFYEVVEIKDEPENWTWNTSVMLRVKDVNGEEIIIEALLCELSQTDIKLKIDKWGE